MSIFSTYSTGDNRVAASILAVLRSPSLDRIQRLLGGLLEQSEFELIRFENQPSKGGQGLPDGIIQSSIWIKKHDRPNCSRPTERRHG